MGRERERATIPQCEWHRQGKGASSFGAASFAPLCVGLKGLSAEQTGPTCKVGKMFVTPPREIDFHGLVYIPEGNPFKIWYSGTRMMDTTTDTIDNAPGLVPPDTLNHTCCV